jgi:antitoxin component of RelBE/YafQ-DinJ toxin-antitoxin module
MKKSKIKYEESTLNFRVPNEIKDEIVQKAQHKNMTVSRYLRQVLEEVLNGTLHKSEVKVKEEPKFLSSIEFLRLMLWVYQKKEDSKLIEPKEQLEEFTRTLKRLDGHLPEEIIREFDKVLTNVITIKKDGKYNNERFDFPNPYGSNQFDYGKVERYFLAYSIE